MKLNYKFVDVIDISLCWIPGTDKYLASIGVNELPSSDRNYLANAAAEVYTYANKYYAADITIVYYNIFMCNSIMQIIINDFTFRLEFIMYSV